jgi:hypothetical protein
MKFPVFAIFLLLLLLGNCFALYKMFTTKQEFLVQFPKLSGQAYNLFRLLPAINIIAIAGLWFLKPWAACLAIACCTAIIIFDGYFGIYYHLYVAIPSTLILLFFIIKYWNEFK